MPTKKYKRVYRKIKNLLDWHDAFLFRGSGDPDRADYIEESFKRLKKQTIKSLCELDTESIMFALSQVMQQRGDLESAVAGAIQAMGIKQKELDAIDLEDYDKKFLEDALAECGLKFN